MGGYNRESTSLGNTLHHHIMGFTYLVYLGEADAIKYLYLTLCVYT